MFVAICSIVDSGATKRAVAAISAMIISVCIVKTPTRDVCEGLFVYGSIRWWAWFALLSEFLCFGVYIMLMNHKLPRQEHIPLQYSQVRLTGFGE